MPDGHPDIRAAHASDARISFAACRRGFDNDLANQTASVRRTRSRSPRPHRFWPGSTGVSLRFVARHGRWSPEFGGFVACVLRRSLHLPRIRL